MGYELVLFFNGEIVDVDCKVLVFEGIILVGGVVIFVYGSVDVLLIVGLMISSFVINFNGDDYIEFVVNG